MEPLADPELAARAGAVRGAWRRDEWEWSRAAVVHWQHRRTLADIARACLHGGRTVVVTAGGAAFRGTVVAVGNDLLRLASATGRVDVHLACDGPIVLRVLTEAPADGTRGDGGAATFRARVYEHEAAGFEAELGVTSTGEVLVGRLVVGSDHVGVQDDVGDVTYLPMRAVAWVRPRVR